MKTVLIVLLGYLIYTPLIFAEDGGAYNVARGPIDEADGVVSYFLSSAYVNGECRVRILRPEKPTDRVLYLLPVTPWPGFEDKWDRLGSGMAEIVKHDSHNRFGYVVVVPDFPEHMPWFVDHATDPKRRHESYMMNVLVPFTDRILEIEKPVRDLAGFSKAGFGSLSLLLRHPDIFNAASAWDVGGVNVPYTPDATKGLGHAAGSQAQFDNYRLGTSIRENAAHFQERKRIAISGYSSDAFLDRLRVLRDLLSQEDLTYSYSESVQMPHRWYSGWMEQALDSLQNMRE